MYLNNIDKKIGVVRKNRTIETELHLMFPRTKLSWQTGKSINPNSQRTMMPVDILLTPSTSW